MLFGLVNLYFHPGHVTLYLHMNELHYCLLTYAKWQYVWSSWLMCCLILYFITMLCHLSFSSNVLDDWCLSRESYWPVLWPGWLWPGWPGWPWDGWLTTGLWHCASTWVYYLGHCWLITIVRTWVYFFCFRHTSDLWSWYIVNDKLMVWK